MILGGLLFTQMLRQMSVWTKMAAAGKINPATSLPARYLFRNVEVLLMFLLSNIFMNPGYVSWESMRVPCS